MKGLTQQDKITGKTDCLTSTESAVLKLSFQNFSGMMSTPVASERDEISLSRVLFRRVRDFARSSLGLPANGVQRGNNNNNNNNNNDNDDDNDDNNNNDNNNDDDGDTNNNNNNDNDDKNNNNNINNDNDNNNNNNNNTNRIIRIIISK